MRLLLINLVGWICSTLLVTAYYLNSRNMISSRSLKYQFMNLIGSIGLVINTIYFGAYPSASVNVVWAFIGLFALLQLR